MERVNAGRYEDHGLETEVASLTEGSGVALPIVAADWTVKTDMLGEEGPPPASAPLVAPPRSKVLAMVFLVVEVEMAVAKEMGMRQRPFPCKYCMAVPISSSISFATCCSVIVMLSLLLDDAACAGAPLLLLPPFPCMQSPPYHIKSRPKKKKFN